MSEKHEAEQELSGLRPTGLSAGSKKLIALALTVACPDEHCRVAVGVPCFRGGGVDTNRAILALLRIIEETPKATSP